MRFDDGAGEIKVLIIPRKILDDIAEHSVETYPEECCGILVGRDESDDRIVTESHRAKNVAEERRHERYLIDERKLIDVMKATPSRPSGFDTETAAWPGYSYLIASVEKDGVASVRSWTMPDGSDTFVEESMKIEEDAQA